MFDPEDRVIAAVLFEAQVRDDGACVLAEAGLEPRHFQKEAHRRVWTAFQELAAAGETVSAATALNHLRAQDRLRDASEDRHLLIDLLNSTPTSASIASDAQLVRGESARRRLATGLGNLVNACEGASSLRDLVGDLVDLAEDAQEDLAGRDDLAAIAMSGTELLRLELPGRTSYLGHGLLPAGVLTLLVGAPGSGKTWLLLQIAVALALGEPCLGLTTRTARVGILELENEDRDLQPRLAAVLDGLSLAPERRLAATERIEFLTPDRLRASRFNLIEERTRVARWIRKNRLQVLIVDSLERTHSGDENEDMPQLVTAFERLARETDVALLVLHHERKAGDARPGSASRAADLNATRGHTVLTATAKVQLRLADAQRGKLRVLRCGKVNFGRTPDAIYLLQTETGLFVLTDKPADSKAEGEANRASVRDLLKEVGSDGITAKDGGERLNLSAKTFQRHADSLGATKIGRPARWALGSSARRAETRERTASGQGPTVQDESPPTPTDSGQPPP